MVSLDGRPQLDLPRGVTITGYERSPHMVRGVLTGARGADDRLVVAVPPAAGDRREIAVRTGDRVSNQPVEAGGLVRIVAAGEQRVTFTVESL